MTPSDGLELFFLPFLFFLSSSPHHPHSPQEQSGVGGGNFLENKLTSPRHPPSKPPPPPPPPPLLASPPEQVSLSLCLHMKVIDLGLYDLFIDTKTALRWGGGRREGGRERGSEPGPPLVTTPFLQPRTSSLITAPPTSCLFSLSSSFKLSPSTSCALPTPPSPPPSQSYINVTNHIAGLATGPPQAAIGRWDVER